MLIFRAAQKIRYAKGLGRSRSAGRPNVTYSQTWKKIAILFLTSSLSLIKAITMPDTYHDIENRISEAVKSLASQKKPPTSQKLLGNFVFPRQDSEIDGMVDDQKVY